MENLYKKIDESKERSKNEALDIVAKSNGITTSIINYALLKMFKEIEQYKFCYYDYKYEDIPAKLRFDISKDKSEEKIDVIYVPEEYFDNMGQLIITFIKSHCLGFANYNNSNNSIHLYQPNLSNTTINNVKRAIYEYMEIISNRLTKIEKEKLNALIKKIDSYSVSRDDSITEELDYSLFQKMFIEQQLANLINKKIETIDHNNFMKDIKSTKIDKRITITSNSSSQEKNQVNISQEYIKPLSQLIKDFINFYKLGKVYDNYYNTYIYFDCTLKQLMDAYYMEMQRSEYIMAHAKKQKTTVRSLFKKLFNNR